MWFRSRNHSNHHFTEKVDACVLSKIIAVVKIEGGILYAIIKNFLESRLILG